MSVLRVAPDRLGRDTAEWIEARVAEAVDRRGVAHLALSGGSTPRPAFEALASMPIEWDRVHVWQVDERIAPDGDPRRNASMLDEALLGQLPPAGEGGPHAHLMPVGHLGVDRATALVPTSPELTAVVAAYRQMLSAAGDPPVLDVVHLGIGPDGHTASWVPGDEGIDAGDEVGVTSTIYQGTRRLTLTPACVNRARARVVMVAGDDKADALGRMLAGDPSVPASRVTTTSTTVITSIAAPAQGIGSRLA